MDQFAVFSKNFAGENYRTAVSDGCDCSYKLNFVKLKKNKQFFSSHILELYFC